MARLKKAVDHRTLPRKRQKVKKLHENLISQLAEMTGLFDYQVKKVIISFIRLTLATLANGDEVHLLGLGKFRIKKRFWKRVHNPSTNEWEDGGWKYTPNFKFGPTAIRFIKNEIGKILGSKDKAPD